MLLVAPTGALAANEFDGTWKSDQSSWKSTTPDEYLLKDGTYTCLAGCSSRTPVPADGAFHAIVGSSYSDAMAATAVDDHTVRLEFRKKGAPVGGMTIVVSGDGTTLTAMYSMSANTNGGPPVTGTSIEHRVGPAPAGAHAVSGKWVYSGGANTSANGLETTYKTSGDTLTMTSPTGQTYTAVVGGPDAPYNGDPGVNGVSLRRVGPHAIEETDKLDGKVVMVVTNTVSDDGKTMTTVWSDKRTGGDGSAVAVKE
jgi:hypothetical protein